MESLVEVVVVVKMEESETTKKLPSVRRVTKSGSTLMVSIPRDVRELFGLEKGDRIEVHFTDKIYKKEEVKKELFEETSGVKMVRKAKEEETLPTI